MFRHEALSRPSFAADGKTDEAHKCCRAFAQENAPGGHRESIGAGRGHRHVLTAQASLQKPEIGLVDVIVGIQVARQA